jgi:tetratricopeptide (TPR) repeat protein
MSQTQDQLKAVAKAALQSGRPAQAESLARDLLSSSPKDGELRLLLGLSLARLGRLSEAKTELEAASRHLPQAPEPLSALATVLLSMGQVEEGLDAAVRAASLRPEDPDYHSHVGHLLISLRQHRAALGPFRKALEIDRLNLVHRQNYAACLADAGLEEEAISEWKKTVKLFPESKTAWLSLSRLLLSRGRVKEAIKSSLRGVENAPESSDAQLMAGLTLAEDGQSDQARPYLEKAIALGAGGGLAQAAMGYWLQEQGHFEEAQANLEESIRINPAHGFAYYNLFRSKKTSQQDEGLIRQMQELVEDPAAPLRDKGYIHYALGKAYEDLKDYEAAMSHYRKGNEAAYEIWLAPHPWERDAYAADLREKEAFYTPEVFADGRVQGSNDETPVYIVGMMRSGTSLTEQILSSHPEVAGAGELTFWHDEEPRVWKDGVLDWDAIPEAAMKCLAKLREFSPHAKRVTDKLPHNYAMVGHIHAAFPRAKFIHIHREPLDNCLSIYTTAYQKPPAFAHSEENIVFAYREYQRIMDHWRKVLPRRSLFEVSYEEIVADRETVAREMIAFIGLEWSDSCLHHETNQRSVRTPSMWQVRQPIYKTSVQRWKRFEPWLGPLAELKPSNPSESS